MWRDQMSCRELQQRTVCVTSLSSTYITHHITVSHRENVITPTPPQLLLIVTDKSSMWHVHDTNFNQVCVILNINASSNSDGE